MREIDREKGRGRGGGRQRNRRTKKANTWQSMNENIVTKEKLPNKLSLWKHVFINTIHTHTITKICWILWLFCWCHCGLDILCEQHVLPLCFTYKALDNDCVWFEKIRSEWMNEPNTISLIARNAQVKPWSNVKLDSGKHCFQISEQNDEHMAQQQKNNCPREQTMRFSRSETNVSNSTTIEANCLEHNILKLDTAILDNQ